MTPPAPLLNTMLLDTGEIRSDYHIHRTTSSKGVWGVQDWHESQLKFITLLCENREKKIENGGLEFAYYTYQNIVFSLYTQYLGI